RFAGAARRTGRPLPVSPTWHLSRVGLGGRARSLSFNADRRGHRSRHYVGRRARAIASRVSSPITRRPRRGGRDGKTTPPKPTRAPLDRRQADRRWHWTIRRGARIPGQPRRRVRRRKAPRAVGRTNGPARSRPCRSAARPLACAAARATPQRSSLAPRRATRHGGPAPRSPRDRRGPGTRAPSPPGRPPPPPPPRAPPPSTPPPP